MIRLTLRTLLAYIDDTLEPDEARVLGAKVADSEEAQKIIERIRQATRRRGLGAPVAANDEDGSNPNVVAEYLSDNLSPELVSELEDKCLESDLHLAEVAACHQILTVILTDPVRVPPTANQRMYMLVPSPAADHSRKPGKTTPIGGVLPALPEQPDADDPDAALLLGMKRYADSDSWAGRMGLVASVVLCAAGLLLAIFFALPPRDTQSPETTPPTQVALAPVPTPVTPKPPEPKKSDIPEPKKVDTPDPKKSDIPEPKKVDTPDPKKVDMPDPKKDGPKPEDLAPLPGNDEVGKIDKSDTSLVLTRAPDATAKWTRLESSGRSTVRANDYVMALPGFKGDIKLGSGVVVHLWGNVPDQVSIKPPLLESRVRFHPAVGGLAADLSLDAGRIYIKAPKGGAKVRVRIGTEVWDVQLRDDKSEILVQATTAFVPGTPFARSGGEKPRTEARLVTLEGSIDFQAPARFKNFDGVAPMTEILWDSKSGQLSAPHAAPKDALATSKLPSLEGEQGKAIQRVLFEAQKSLTNPEGVRVLLKERLVADPLEKPRPGLLPADVVFATQWAMYSQAAIMEGAEAPDLLKDVLDPLKADSRAYARQASVIALSNWVARLPDNTELLVKGILDKGWEDDVPGILVPLLRGYASADMKDKGAALSGLDKLLEWLDDPRLAIREAALGNLLGFYAGPDTFTQANRILFTTDLTARVAAPKVWENFLKAWKDHAETIRQRIADKK